MPNNHTLLMPAYRLLGVALASNFCLPNRIALPPDVPADVIFAHSVVESLPWDGAEELPIYVSPYMLRDGESLLYVYRQPEYDVLRFPNTADFYIWPDRIACYQLRRASAYEVRRWLSGTVIALWLERKGTPVLHASAVVVGDSGIAFLGSNHAGKSSLAAALMQREYPMLTDDALPLTPGDNTIIGHPGYPEMRMWPDLAQHFLGHFDDLELVHPDATKRNVPVGPESLGSFCDFPRPMRCLYVPTRRDPQDGGTAVEITPVSCGEALIELVRYSFSTRLLTALGLQAQRLNSLAEIVREVPLRRICYPSGLEHLPGTCDTILEDVRALPH
jgi:hypothetical protein